MCKISMSSRHIRSTVKCPRRRDPNYRSQSIIQSHMAASSCTQSQLNWMGVGIRPQNWEPGDSSRRELGTRITLFDWSNHHERSRDHMSSTHFSGCEIATRSMHAAIHLLTTIECSRALLREALTPTTTHLFLSELCLACLLKARCALKVAQGVAAIMYSRMQVSFTDASPE